MSGRGKSVLLALAVAALALGAAASQVGADPSPPKPLRAEDFQLADQNYVGRRLHKMRDARAIVLISYRANDPAIHAEGPVYRALGDAYAPKGVEFLMIDSVLGETRDVVRPDLERAGIALPVLFDYEQLVGESLDLDRAAEALVIDPRSWSVVFRGPASSAATRQALDALVAGKPAFTLASEPARGARIDFPRKSPAKKAEFSYAKDIAPIVAEKCVVCHQPGGIGPMTLTRYEDIKAFAPMIREALRTRRMPPFQPDVTVGKFAPNEGLSSSQLRALVHWIEAGAPRGAGEDPLARVSFTAPDWPLGKPDLIVKLPEVKVPATGVLDYQKPVVETGLTEGRWIKATAFRVTDRRVLHHITTGLRVPDESGRIVTLPDSKGGIGGQGPGRTVNLTPPEMGMWIPAGSAIAFETHYTPYGKETTEKTEMGIYFHPKGQDPKYPMRVYGMYDMGITIPAGAEYHPEITYTDIPKDMYLYGLTPHAHVRGGSTQVSIQFPDGREEIILAVPHYRFDWQCEYYLAEPILVPAGSRVINRWTYDNSTRNFANPAPDKDVTFGEQSWEEMLTFFLHYRWVGESVADLRDDYDAVLLQGQLMGVLDDNMDGRLVPAELRGRQGEGLKARFSALDVNGDQALDNAEVAVVMRALTARSQQVPATAMPPKPAAAN